MARINIYEQDNTVVNTATGTENIVYVPGYAKMGPTNKPTLCNSLAAFTELFGDAPYNFPADSMSADEYAYNGDSLLEKSWLYATELLRAGIPVLYERLYNVSSTEDETVKAYGNIGFYDAESALVSDANIQFTAKNEGTYGEDIQITIERSAVSGSDNIYVQLGEIVETYEGVTYTDSEAESYIANRMSTSALVDVTVNITSAESIEGATFSQATTQTPYVFLLSGGLDMTYSAIITLLKTDGSSNPYTKFEDKLTYDVKFLTSGGYPNVISASDYTIAQKMLRVAAERGEAVAFMDVAKGTSASSYLSIVQTAFGTTDKVMGAEINTFGTCVGPQCLLSFTSISQNVWMPGSFVWLKAFATSVVSSQNPVWYPVAGVERGQVANFIEAEFDVGSTILANWQDGRQCINPIMNVRGYGYCIFGNRTLIRNSDAENPSALAFLNVRVLVNELKKITRSACLRLTFENNDSLLWNKFKNLVSPTLDRMRTNRGIEDYKMERLESTQLGVVNGLITIVPIESAENFEITFSLNTTNSTVEVE